MNKSKEIRDDIIEFLKSKSYDVVIAEINANYYNAMDVAITENGNTDIYRISVIKHNQEKINA